MDTERPPLWRRLFDCALSDLGAVRLSRRLGYRNHTLVSLIRSGKEAASPRFQARVIELFHVVECPQTNARQARSECERIANGPAPTQNPHSMWIWKTCQTCPHKPEAQS